MTEQKILILASGSGTNADVILKNIQNGVLEANPIGVITNKPDAGVIEKALRYGVETTIIPSQGSIKRIDPEKRVEYEKKLLEAILNHPKGLPDVIVLAGWMLVLSDVVLKPLAEKGISIINLHPALLSGLGQATVTTSMGEIPEIRGAHAIDDAFAIPIQEMPVTGVTVHYVLPSQDVDTGSVIMRKEVVRSEDETKEELEKRIHAAEYEIFSMAIKMVLDQRRAR